MKKKVRIMAVMLMVACMIFGTMQVSAADERLGTVVDGSLLTDETTVEATAYGRMRGAYLNYGTGNLTVKGFRSINMSGSTNAYQSVDRINLSLLLQRLVGNSWVTVNTIGPKSKYNTYTISGSGTYSVAGGYYYRVYGTHSIVEGSTSEATSSCTDGVWIE